MQNIRAMHTAEPLPRVSLENKLKVALFFFCGGLYHHIEIHCFSARLLGRRCSRLEIEQAIARSVHLEAMIFIYA